MRKFVIVFTFLITSFALHAESFSSLGKHHVADFFAQISNASSLINEAIAPEDVKQFRKDLGLFKINLDIFIPIYPVTKFEKRDDLFLEFRELVDEGYESIGAFKDLTLLSSTPSPEKIEKRRKKV